MQSPFELKIFLVPVRQLPHWLLFTTNGVFVRVNSHLCLICARENLQLRAWLTKRKTSVEICVVYESVLKITKMENKIILKNHELLTWVIGIVHNTPVILHKQSEWVREVMNKVKWKEKHFNAEKILSLHMGMQNVCVSVCLSLGRNWIIFDWMFESWINFHSQYKTEVVALGLVTSPMGPTTGALV